LEAKMHKGLIPALLLATVVLGVTVLTDGVARAAPVSPARVVAASAGPPVDPAAPFTPKVESLLSALSVDEKLSLVRGNGFDLVNFAALDPGALGQAGFLAGVPRLGIPPRRDADAVGINVWADATAVPTRLGIAAAFDRPAASRLGQLEGNEGRALGVDLLYGPSLDVDRLPNDGHANTTYGEDPYLAGQLAAEEVDGVQVRGLMAEATGFGFFEGQNAGPAALGGDASPRRRSDGA
jgi:beta-glucosidase